MRDEHDILLYHGRRSVDELVGALAAETVTVALVHKELSRLHHDRFVSLMKSTAEDVQNARSRLSAPVNEAEARQRSAP